MSNKYFKHRYLLSAPLLFLLVLPDLALAIPTTFKAYIDYILSIIDVLVPILVALAFAVFFWGMSKFILNSGKPEDIKKGREYMLWGLLALFVLVSIRAIIAFIQTDLEIDSSLTPFLKTATIEHVSTKLIT